jgi:hypothetical protein
MAISVKPAPIGNVQVATHALDWRGVHGRRPKCLSEEVAKAASSSIPSGVLVSRRGTDGGEQVVGSGGQAPEGWQRSSLVRPRLDVMR